MNKEDDYRSPIGITFTITETSIEVIIRNIRIDDIYKILQLQEVSFADMAAYDMVWPASYLKKHIHIFPEGQINREIHYSSTFRILDSRRAARLCSKLAIQIL
ncbi:MAG: hypothetical protein ACJ718_03665 [Nitrososphaeraceae archaeon]